MSAALKRDLDHLCKHTLRGACQIASGTAASWPACGVGRPTCSVKCDASLQPGAPLLQVKLLKCLVDNIVVDISFETLGGLCTVAFLESIDRNIGENHLFKRSVILVSWLLLN